MGFWELVIPYKIIPQKRSYEQIEYLYGIFWLEASKCNCFQSNLKNASNLAGLLTFFVPLLVEINILIYGFGEKDAFSQTS